VLLRRARSAPLFPYTTLFRSLFNRRRQLLCLAELHRAGVPIIPHLSAVMPEDWRFWRDFLERNPSLRFVAVEFQTGNKNPPQGRSEEHTSELQSRENLVCRLL